ncbi:unnamed protein product [Rhizoctonia solani]|uniref:Uncharacterized protein n=1 Tax=Rhizoctonia solani TaxID=456999 RepID=A0A8H3HJ06_9AGAM|nr:unnamed protein product [Rhizoctonia solani]
MISDLLTGLPPQKMESELHTHWGRTIDQYTESYGLNDAMKRISLVEDIQRPAQAAIERIGQVWSKKSDHGVNLSDLQAVLAFSQSAGAYPSFASPSLISGCIYLMAEIKVSGKSTPFSYEYGYLCFRIMSVALGMCLLDRSGTMESAIETMTDNQHIALIQTLARLVDGVVEDAVRHAAGPHKQAYNCILGWTHCPEHPKREKMISRADAATLFGVLWDDRESFLKVMAATVPPVLSSVIYLLWRYVIYERYLQVQHSPESGPPISGNVFMQIFWRAYLTIAPDQNRTFNLISTYENYGLGFRSQYRDASGHTTLEDTKQMMRAYTNQVLRGSALTSRSLAQALSIIYLHLVSVGPDYE